MGRRRLLAAIGMAALLASVSAGLLLAADRGQIAAPRASAGKATAKPEVIEEERVAPPPAFGPKAPVAAAASVEIISPESGAKLRGTAVVKVDYPNPMGYVIFRIDDRFAYATTTPFEMRWDTSGALDGQHIVAVDAYDASARYAGTASINVMVENSIPTPPNGVLLSVRFDEHDILNRVVTARGELSALASDESLPTGFEALEGSLRAEITSAVLDAFYEGSSALVRSRLREATLVTDGTGRGVPEIGLYVMVQISRNGLAVPATASTTKPRLGLAEISAALRDFPVVPGDSWEAPIGVVCDLYTRRAIFVQARHVFEGLRWYRGRECAVVTSNFTIPEVPLLVQAQQPAGEVGTISTSGLTRPSFGVALTGGMRGGRRGGGGMRGGGGGMRGGGAGGMRGGGGRGGAGGRAGAGAGRAPGAAGAGGQRGAAAGTLQSARLVDLEGTRRTYLTRQSGRVLYTEDTILGQVEFRAGGQAMARSFEVPLTIELTGGMRGGRRGGGGMRGGGGGGGGGMRGGGGGGGMGGGGGRRGGQGTQRGATGRAPGEGATRGGNIPPRLDYGFRLTTELVIE